MSTNGHMNTKLWCAICRVQTDIRHSMRFDMLQYVADTDVAYKQAHTKITEQLYNLFVSLYACKLTILHWYSFENAMAQQKQKYHSVPQSLQHAKSEKKECAAKKLKKTQHCW